MICSLAGFCAKVRGPNKSFRQLDAVPSAVCQALLDLQLYANPFLSVGNIEMELSLFPLDISLCSLPLEYIISI
jgi:hypothetical protein